MRRGHEISTRYNVGVWICIRKENGQFYIYNSDPTRTDWPPSCEQLVGLCEHLILPALLSYIQGICVPCADSQNPG
jgi:hypothetical protein